MKTVRLYPPADPTAKVGIPVDGELFAPDDAKRLVGQGLASRTPARNAGIRAGGDRRVSRPAKRSEV